MFNVSRDVCSCFTWHTQSHFLTGSLLLVTTGYYSDVIQRFLAWYLLLSHHLLWRVGCPGLSDPPGPYHKLWRFAPTMLLDNKNVIYTFDYFVPEAFTFGESAISK